MNSELNSTRWYINECLCLKRSLRWELSILKLIFHGISLMLNVSYYWIQEKYLVTVRYVWKVLSFAAMHLGQYRMQDRKTCPSPGAHDLSRSYRQPRRQTLIDRMCFFRPYEHVRSVRHHMNKKVETSSPFFFSSTISLTLPPHVLKRGGGKQKLRHSEIPMYWREVRGWCLSTDR